MINTNELSEKELASVQKLEQKIFRGELSYGVALKYFSILADYLNIMTPSDYAKLSKLSYNTARTRLIYKNSSVMICAIN